ncbi:MAG: HD domain-containing protein [bacterium]|jgi:putative hydrolase of HD superfamily
MDSERLEKQMAFIVEIDRIKQVLRRTVVIGTNRHENDAEHSWHLAMMAILLAEYAEGRSVDILKVLKMVLVHDLVEIDAGDTYCYDEEGAKDKSERETRAADRIFAMLPDDQGSEIRSLWDEFEEMTTREARFANALDRLQPLLLNYHSGGKSWQKHQVTSERVLMRAQPIAGHMPGVWEFAAGLIRDAVEQGFLAE